MWLGTYHAAEDSKGESSMAPLYQYEACDSVRKLSNEEKDSDRD